MATRSQSETDRAFPLPLVVLGLGLIGVNPEQCLPIVVEQPRLLQDLTESAERASVTRQDNIVIVGIDPERGFGTDHPLFQLDWVAGSPEEAVKQMRQSRACIVPDHFLTETGLQVGDGFDLVPPDRPEKPVRYTIAGAVRLPGWHWQTKLTGFRSRTHRAAALAFANYDLVAEDFDFPVATHVWLNYANSQADPDKIAAAAQTIYDDSSQRNPSQMSGNGEEPTVRIMPVEAIRDKTRTNAAGWIWAISQLPILATAIAAIGVLNVILASVRSRQWELGVLRSIGISQSEIIRAILAEGLLIGIVASLLSLGFGIMAGWCGCGIAQYVSFFGGLHPALQVPWLAIGVGLLFVCGLSVLAALWPALAIGRLRPLMLLERGGIAG
ncbi:Macrolide export ATP-binding/permease protein MacB [Symmachiella dynata]|uniref:ABC transporter permease n=1 Tax=Symmachiella dynata TaxID=2527995 RepID=UPI001189987E|nr:ABC transporter permease [Symmachiella dynata]QDT49004.1 Macrolide export ATP-binding/permease protein MacB [Symmachiella dynata]